MNGILKNKTIIAPPSEITEKKIKIRQSGVELYKILALFLICISHCVQTAREFSFVDLDVSYFSFPVFLLKFLEYFGNFGNAIFIICSSYFLQKSKRAKTDKFLKLLFDSQFISVIIFLFCIVFSMTEYFSFPDWISKYELIIKQIFPDLFEVLWFIPVYVTFYLIHPYLNVIIENLSQKKYFVFCIIIFLFYGVSGAFFNKQPMCTSFFSFILIYFIVGYASSYCKNFENDNKKNIIGFILFFGLFVVSVSLKYYMQVNKIPYGDIFAENNLLSIIILPMFIFLFNIFHNMKFKNKFINYISSCSLFFYCIHENYFVRLKFRPMYYEFLINHLGKEYIMIYIFLLIVVLFVCAMACAVIYKCTIHKLTQKLSVKARDLISVIFDKLFEKSHKIFS